MTDEKLRQNAAAENDWETWDSWNEDLDKALPNWDRWNNDLKQLLPESEKPEQKESVFPEKPKTAPAREKTPASNVEKLAAVQKKTVEKGPVSEPQNDENVKTVPKRPEILTSDKELLFFIQKHKRADRICAEAGISLPTLQRKVGYLSHRLKRYIDVQGLYRDTAPVKVADEGICISRDHLIESGFSAGDRFKVDFKDKYIVLSKLPMPGTES